MKRIAIGCIFSALVLALFATICFADEKSCGKIEVTFSNGSKVEGKVVAETLPDQTIIIRARFIDYEEMNSWIAIIQDDSPRHPIEKAAMEACDINIKK